MVHHNFQPVIFAGGRGTRFPDIVNNKPKCLIPIGPYPMIWHPLNMLEKHEFQDCLIVVLESQKTEIQQAIERCPLKIKIEYVSLPTGSDLGTADALIHLKDKIKENCDILIVSCDVVTDIKLFPLLQIFRQHDASLAIQLFRSVHLADVTVPGPKAKHKPDRDLIGIHPETNRLLFLASTSDFEENVALSTHRLRKNGQMTMYSNMVDSHIYVMKKWVIDFLCADIRDKQSFSTVKGELLPYIVKKQMARLDAPFSDKPTSEANVNYKSEDIFQFISPCEIEKKITETSVFNDSRSRLAYNSDKIRCYAVIAPRESFGIRVNNILGYCTANKKIFNLLQNLNTDEKLYISTTAVINSTQFSNCTVGDGTTISEKTSIRGTVFGSNCKVSEKTRISDCILMNGIIVEDGVVIENCIICDKATIKKGSHLKNCLVGPSYTVLEKSVHEKAHLTTDDGLMEIE